MTTTAAAAGTRRHTGTYPAEPAQVGQARAALAGWLGGGPRADEAIVVASDSLNLLTYSFGLFWCVFVSGGCTGCRDLPWCWGGGRSG